MQTLPPPHPTASTSLLLQQQQHHGWVVTAQSKHCTAFKSDSYRFQFEWLSVVLPSYPNSKGGDVECALYLNVRHNSLGAVAPLSLQLHVTNQSMYSVCGVPVGSKCRQVCIVFHCHAGMGTPPTGTGAVD